ncbi:M20/M25/M40 family metallo-hydrolase [Saccharibacillus sp. CPCC 101409]|uniref:M42 family metallopeptidase n=1 Tax=Saccharibacillus sp. CPCC 101409 TaxID=3058041 RepID=UPI002671AC81|nr:M20/M25/M40 family metallo-hydrolase [Saccharibacillus sp. CPCC 101409]MDO3411254.1 M20/M25/M40 family metallo-hydrolase [Saccharibacillus sp. CPCC 101409]
MSFEQLTQISGLSGYEGEVRTFIEEQVAPYADEVTTDAIGNLIVFKKGTGEHKKTIMAAAHMDEVGFQVIKIEKDGLIRIKFLGYSHLRSAYMSRIVFTNGTVGVIGSSVPPDDLKHFTQLYVDIGLRSEEEVKKHVNVGDNAVYIGPYTELAGGFAVAKAIDDRVGCHMMIESLKSLKECYNDVYFVFTVQEEVGCRGSRVAAERIKPDIGLAVDITPAHDTPGDLTGSNAVGAGPAIKVSDTSVICDELLVSTLKKLSEQNGIPYQLDVIYVGGTDASSINQSHFGVKAAGLSVVTRYAHCANTLASLKDVDHATRLLTHFVNERYDF